MLYAYLFDLLNAAFENTTIELSLAAPRDVAYFSRAFPELYVTSQVEGNLGARMHTSFQHAFSNGAARAVLTGSDIPGLDAALVREAFAALEHQPAVIGPAADGGYYLIGMRTPGANLFRNIAWSTDNVLAQTEAQAQRQGLSLTRLRTLVDIDTGDDYRAWRANTNEVTV